MMGYRSRRHQQRRPLGVGCRLGGSLLMMMIMATTTLLVLISPSPPVLVVLAGAWGRTRTATSRNGLSAFLDVGSSKYEEAIDKLLKQQRKKIYIQDLLKKKKHSAGAGATPGEQHTERHHRHRQKPVEGVSFLWKDEQQEQQNTARQHKPVIHTKVGGAAKQFDGVLRANKQTGHVDIDMIRLLRACKYFERSMHSIGQRQSARDLRNNIRKTETFLEKFSLGHHIEKLSGHHQHVGMEQVLLTEKQAGVHTYDDHTGRLLRLEEHSCAIAMLWIRRSLKFQYIMFKDMLEHYEASHAAKHAYEQILKPYHGQVLQKVYAVAFRASAPSTHQWLARLGGYDAEDFTSYQEEATRRDLQHLLDVWKPILDRWDDVYHDLNLNDPRRV